MPGTQTCSAVMSMIPSARVGRRVTGGGPLGLFRVYNISMAKTKRSVFILCKKNIRARFKNNANTIINTALARAKELTLIKHPGVIKVVSEIFDTSDRIFFVTERVNMTLGDILTQKSALDELSIRFNFLNICETVRCLHEAGRAGIDLSLSSLMLTSDNRLVLSGGGGGIPYDDIYSLPRWCGPETRFQQCPLTTASDVFMLASIGLGLGGSSNILGLKEYPPLASETPESIIGLYWYQYVADECRSSSEDVSAYKSVMDEAANVSSYHLPEMVESNEAFPTGVFTAHMIQVLLKCLSPFPDKRPSLTTIISSLGSLPNKFLYLLSMQDFVTAEEYNKFLNGLSSGTMRSILSTYDKEVLRSVVLPKAIRCLVTLNYNSNKIMIMFKQLLCNLLANSEEHDVERQNGLLWHVVFDKWEKEKYNDARSLLQNITGVISCIISAKPDIQASQDFIDFCKEAIELVPLFYKTVYDECGKPLLFWAMNASPPKIYAQTCRMLMRFAKATEEHKRKPSHVKKLARDALLILFNEKRNGDSHELENDRQSFNKYTNNRAILVGLLHKFATDEDMTGFVENLIGKESLFDPETHLVIMWLLYSVHPHLSDSCIILCVIPYLTRLVQYFSEEQLRKPLEKVFSLLKVLVGSLAKRVSFEDKSTQMLASPTFQVQTPNITYQKPKVMLEELSQGPSSQNHCAGKGVDMKL